MRKWQWFAASRSARRTLNALLRKSSAYVVGSARSSALEAKLAQEFLSAQPVTHSASAQSTCSRPISCSRTIDSSINSLCAIEEPAFGEVAKLQGLPKALHRFEPSSLANRSP